jgi:hypothetical protein
MGTAATADDHGPGGIQFDEMWDALAEATRCCQSIPDCDATGKIRGNLGRLETSLREAQQTADLSGFRADAKSAEDLVRRIHDADPLTRLLQCLSALNERIVRQ